MIAHKPIDLNRRRFLGRAVYAGLALTMLPRLAGAMEDCSAEETVPNILSILDGLGLRHRDQWAAVQAVTTRMKRTGAYSRLTVHHSGSRTSMHVSEERVVRELNSALAAHRQRNYADLGYHFAVDYAGRIWEGRSLDFEGAHVSGANTGNIGVLALGNFEEQHPSRAQLAGLGELVDRLLRHYAIPVSDVFGHRDLGASSCPGGKLYPFVDLIRQG